MAALRALLLVAALLGVSAHSGPPESYDYEDVASGPPSAVFVLTGDNFDATIKAHKHALVEFYAPWCGVRALLRARGASPRSRDALGNRRPDCSVRRSQHCKALAPEYEAAATQLKETAPDVLIAKARRDIAQHGSRWPVVCCCRSRVARSQADCTVESALCERFSVRGYPTLQVRRSA